MRTLKILWAIGCASLLLGPASSVGLAESKTNLVAYSMRAAQTKIEEAVRSSDDWRKMPDLFYLGGITKPWALVVDTKTGDVILIGERDTGASPLTLDDWVVALRARFLHNEQDPGVTIDPRGESRTATMQDVRFFGGVQDTRFALVLFDSDWLMKKIGLGLERVPVSGLRPYYDLAAEQARSSSRRQSNIGSRFWFFPIVTRVHVFPDVVVLERFQMGVFTEMLYAEVDGKPVADLDRFEHYPSETFSRSFSENYDAVARECNVLDTLRGLSRLAALAKGLTRVETRPNLDYYLHRYPVESVRTPREVPVLRAEDREVGLEVSGGVSLAALAMRAQGGDPNAMRELVLSTRSSSCDLVWEMAFPGGDWSNIVVLPPRSSVGDIGQLYVHGEFLFEQRRYDLAIASWRQVLQSCPEAEDVYFKIGRAFERKAMPAAAAEYYSKGLAVDPFRKNLGMSQVE